MSKRTGWKNINVLGYLETYKNSALSYSLKDRNRFNPYLMPERG